MTEEERSSLREAKKEVIKTLSAIDIPSYRLRVIDERLEEYVSGVCSAPDRHCLWELLAVRRFFALCERYGIDAQAVRRFFAFYEMLHFPGVKGLTRYRLTPVQCFQFASVYGFYSGGRRVVREAVLFVPRKFSKTTSSAAFALYDLLFGDANAESYTGANSSDQAKKCFDVIRGAMRRLDPKGRRYVVNEQQIKSLRKDRTAIAQCLTANARTKDGLNASTVIMDEFSQARDAGLLHVLTTSMGARRDPLTVIITTASDVFSGPFYSMLQGYKRLLLGDYEDDSIFLHLFEPDVDDDEGDERTWLKVHPHLGVTVSLDFYHREWARARREGGSSLMAFRTKLLNIYADDERRAWIGSTVITDALRSFDAANLPVKGKPDGMVAIDLSESDDFSAVTFGLYDRQTKGFYFHTAYFFPSGALSGHANEQLYRGWAEAGHLQLTDGDVIDYRAIVNYVLGISAGIRVLGVGYDPWKSTEVVNMLAAAGGREYLKSVKQTYGHFTAAVQSFEHGIKTGHIFLNDNPINSYCFGNAVLDYDKLENCKPIKRAPAQKIDGVITTLMCLRLFMDFER